MVPEYMLKVTSNQSALQNHSFVPLPISPHLMLVVFYATCYQSQRKKGAPGCALYMRIGTHGRQEPESKAQVALESWAWYMGLPKDPREWETWRTVLCIYYITPLLP